MKKRSSHKYLYSNIYSESTQTPLTNTKDVNLYNSIESISNQEDELAMKLNSRIYKYEANKDDLTIDKNQSYSLSKYEQLNMNRKGNNLFKEYKKNNEILKGIIEKQMKKKEKLKNFVNNLNSYRKELIEKEQLLDMREKELEETIITYKKEMKLFEKEKQKFENYVYDKSIELLNKANDIKYKLENFNKARSSISSKEDEINHKSKFLLDLEIDLKSKLNKFENEKYKFETEKEEFYMKKEEFKINSEEVINKYNEIKKIQDEMNNSSINLITLEQRIKDKEIELKRIQDKYDEVSKLLGNNNEELNKKFKNINEREIELSKQRIILDEKITECNNKLEEINKTRQDLIDKENVLKIKQRIDKDLEMKISILEANDTLNRKTMEFQQKLLNKSLNCTNSSIKAKK